jgi:hypothetical protein
MVILFFGHAVGEDERVHNLAFERGCEAVPYPGNADFELIGIHATLPWLVCIEFCAPAINFASPSSPVRALATRPIVLLMA